MQDIVSFEFRNKIVAGQDITIYKNAFLYYGTEQLDLYCTNKEKIEKIMIKILINKDSRFAIYVVPETNIIKLQISKAYLHDCFNRGVIPSNNLIAVLRDFPFASAHISPQASERFINHAGLGLTALMPLNSLKLDLMQHQINNVAWIQEVEAQPFKHSYCYNNDYSEITLSDDCKFYIDLNSNMCYSYESLKNYAPGCMPVLFKGGLLCDEVGLGKTLSFVAGILATKPKPKPKPKKISLKKKKDDGTDMNECDGTSTLVLCPKRIMHQWATEIYKYVGDLLSVHVITSILSLKSNNIEKMKKADVVIASIQLLANVNYLHDVNVAKFSSIKWKRVIVDECHEFLVHPFPCKEYRTIWSELMAIKSNARWLCSGTPFAQKNKNLYPMLNYLADDDDCAFNLLDRDYDIIIDQIARRTTKEQSRVVLKEPIYETKIIEFTKYDAIIYADACRAMNDNEKLRICSNIFSVGEKLDEIHIIKDRTEFYLKKIEQGINENSAMETELRELIIKKNYLLGQAQAQSQSQSQAQSQMQMQTNDLQTVKAAIRYRKTNYKLRIEHNLRENEFYESQLELLTKMKRPESICIITGEKLLDDYLICPDGHCYSLKGIKLMRSYKNDRHILCPYTQRKLFPLMFSKPIIKKAWGSKIVQLHNDITYIIGKNYDNENRIIIFSKYEETLKAITAFLEEERYNYICPSGTASQIAIGINKFKTDINIRLLLLCSEKSSAGTNIIEATHIILFDTISINIAKSRAIETQAVARAVRIGQKNHVKVLRYIIKDSIEEELYYSSII